MHIRELAAEVLAESRLWTHEELPFTTRFEPGHPRVLVIAGENAAGKSLLAQSLTSWGRVHRKIAHISVSIRERTGSGTYEMAAMRRVMMFGDEGEQSTGATSARVLETAFNTLHHRAEENIPALLLLDEPELGLSDGFAGAMGTYLATKLNEMPELACGAIVITHSRELVRHLAAGLPERPSFVKTGESATLEEWLEGERARTVEELLELSAVGHARWAKVNAIMRALRAKQN